MSGRNANMSAASFTSLWTDTKIEAIVIFITQQPHWSAGRWLLRTHRNQSVCPHSFSTPGPTPGKKRLLWTAAEFI